MTDLIPIVEPASSDWRDLLDAYERSAQVYWEEAEMLPEGDLRHDAEERSQAFIDAATTLRLEHRIGLMHEGLIDEAMLGSARTLYASQKRFGVSDIGGCRRYVQLLIQDNDFTDPRGEFLAAYIGTAVGDHLERDYIALRNPHALKQMEVTVPIEVIVEGEVFQINLPGHPDIVEPKGFGDSVVDYKTKDGLGVVIREAGTLAHRFQVTLYAKALIVAGVLSAKPRLALHYVDRSGGEERPHTVEWDYDEAIYEEAVQWLSEVVSAEHNGEEAPQDMPRTWCASYCPMFTLCRGNDTDVEGVIRNPEVVSLIDAYDRARAEATAAERVKKAAQAALRGMSGHLPDGRVLRWIHVNDTKIEAHERRGYDKIDLSKPKKVSK